MDTEALKKEFREVGYQLYDHMIFKSHIPYQKIECHRRYEEIKKIINTLPEDKRGWFYEKDKE